MSLSDLLGKIASHHRSSKMIIQIHIYGPVSHRASLLAPIYRRLCSQAEREKDWLSTAFVATAIGLAVEQIAAVL
jgi:hypothetical protein